MALTSPGVEVTITDQSQYLPAPTNSVPLVVLATAQNKANASGTGVAAATTAANAGKLYQVTSQRDLVNLYGTPFFYTTTNGTPIQGYELNEYGLLAAYSLLGVTNRCYVLRADIDLASLVGQTGRPVGQPDSGSYWLDTTASTWGIYVFSATTGKFTLQTPIVITDPMDLEEGVPLQSIGATGAYAVNAIGTTGSPSSATQYFHKTSDNQWVAIGSTAWYASIPTVQGTVSNPTLTNGSFSINVNGNLQVTISITTGDTISDVAGYINDLGFSYLSAAVVDSRIAIYSSQPEPGNDYIRLIAGSGTSLDQLGLTAGYKYQPAMDYGTSAQMPLWSSSQAYPRPTGSVWIKTGAAGNGLAPVVSRYSATTGVWSTKSVTIANCDWNATSALDATGGQAIPAGTIYAQAGYLGFYSQVYEQGPVYLWERNTTGPTVVTGTETSPTFTTTGSIAVYISVPVTSGLVPGHTVYVNSGDTAQDFVTAWATAAIPYTTCTLTTDGAIQITNTAGGEIVLDDFNYTTNSPTGILAEAGFVIGTTPGTKYGPGVINQKSGAALTGGSGTSGTATVYSVYGVYQLNGPGVTAGGSGYSAGDVVTIAGTILGGTSPANDLTLKVAQVGGSGDITALTYVSGTPVSYYTTQLSNWYPLTYTASDTAPTVTPANNTNWFYSVTDEVDIMINYDGQWNGYANQGYDSNGFPSPNISNATDPNGPIVAASAPTTQSDGTSLVYGDLWINTSDLENYPIINRWQYVDGQDAWVVLDNSDQTSSSGVTFLDARWAPNGDTNPSSDPIPSIVSLLSSDYLDIDAPESSNYPTGMLLFNTRRSGYNVKQYRVNYFNTINFPGATLPTVTDAWVTVSGNQSNGAPYMGRKAQRAMVVQAMRSVVDTNTDIRDEDNFFNLMAAPNYCELQPNMVVLNADRGETGYIIGDTPLRLTDSATEIQAWATNAAGATSTSEEGCVTRNTYLGLFYPSGIAPDLSGNLVAVPPSHMMLRTFLRNDTISYPWLAAAGTRRGTIDNATNIGYVSPTTGEFVTIKTRIGIRDVLYINFINPLVFFTGVGLLNYGNKTSYNSSSALDRVNVARLVAYIRRQLTLAARPFVFEPNDALTRQQIAGVVESLMVDLVAKRGLYDYLVVCDESNNTPARIDRNELWIDVAVEPVKAAEFIYVPVRILNTGELSQ